MNDEALCGARNMACDEALLQTMREGDAPILRFYRWNPACLSIGRFQKFDEVSGAKNGEIGRDWVRRPTGGRAVWHQHEITYSVVLHETLLPMGARSVAESYRRISAGFLEGLRLLGINAQIAPSETKPSDAQSSTGISITRNAPSNCFGIATRADFVVDGRKLLGAAQCRKNGAILQHGALLLDADEKLWTARAGGSMARVVTLKSLNVRASRQEIIAALCQGMTNSWRDDFASRHSVPSDFAESIFAESEMTASEIEMANSLHLNKYATPVWNERATELSDAFVC